MDNLVYWILNGGAEFTPEVLVRIIVFVMILSCIANIADACLSVGRR